MDYKTKGGKSLQMRISEELYFEASTLDNPNGMTVVNGKDGKYYHLNRTAQQALRFIHENQQGQSGAQFFTEKFNLAPDNAAALFNQAIDELIVHGFLTHDDFID